MASFLRTSFVSALVATTALTAACKTDDSMDMPSMPDSGTPPPDAGTADPIKVGVIYANGTTFVRADIIYSCPWTTPGMTPPPAISCAGGTSACERKEVGIVQEILRKQELTNFDVRTAADWGVQAASANTMTELSTKVDLVMFALPARNAWCRTTTMVEALTVGFQREPDMETVFYGDWAPLPITQQENLRVLGLLHGLGDAVGLPTTHVPFDVESGSVIGNMGIMSKDINTALPALGNRLEPSHQDQIRRGYLDLGLRTGPQALKSNELAGMKAATGLRM